jgi:hypothetical protein
MITAEEAKNRAISVITSSELEELEKLILDAAEQGEFSIRVPELSTPTTRALGKLGYKTDYKEEYCSSANTYLNDPTRQRTFYWDISW